MTITDLTIIFWTFCIAKAFMNSLRHDYKGWKSRFGIPDKWDFWFNPGISHTNKYKGKLFWFITWEHITPFSDLWHTVWTLWQSGVIGWAIYRDGWVSGLLLTGVVGVFIIFNGIYNFMRRRKFIEI